jgi:ribonuclease P protein component
MISSHHRFHGYRSLGFVYRRGATVRNQHMAIKFVRNQQRTMHRVAVIVSRKVHKSAVSRNRIRRRLYEIVRANEHAITEPYDIVLTVFSDQLSGTSPAKLTSMVVGLLTKAGIVTKPAVSKATQSPRAIVKTKEEHL